MPGTGDEDLKAESRCADNEVGGRERTSGEQGYVSKGLPLVSKSSAETLASARPRATSEVQDAVVFS